VAAIYLTTRYARQELNRILAERNQEAQVQERETAAKEADEERPNNADSTSVPIAGNDETTR
jgi:succinylglutamate desuccinylase